MGRTALGLLLCLAAGEVFAAEVHLKTGSLMTGRIREQSTSAIVMDNIVFEGGEGGIQYSGTDSMSIRLTEIEMLILDEGDNYKKTGDEAYPILQRGDVGEVEDETPEVEDGEEGDVDIDLPGLDDLGGVKPTDEDAQVIWYPPGLGAEVEIPEMKVALRLPAGFTHEVVEKAGRPVLRVISPEKDKLGLGFDLYIQEKRDFAPFDNMEDFYDYSQKLVLAALQSGEEEVEEVGPVHPRIMPKAGSAPRLARGTVYQVGSGSDRRLIEVRILRTFAEFYVFTFATAASISRSVISVFDKSFESLRNLK